MGNGWGYGPYGYPGYGYPMVPNADGEMPAYPAMPGYMMPPPGFPGAPAVPTADAEVQAPEAPADGS